MIEEILGKNIDEFKNILKDIPKSPSKLENLKESAIKADSDGYWLEFGTWKGVSLNIINQYSKQNKVYSFDSFEGLPEDWNSTNKKGMFNEKGKIPFIVEEGTEIVVGNFEDTLPKFVENHKIPKISFLHIDCDLYSSTKTVFNNLLPYFKGKCIIVFDEFVGYDGDEEHEYKAFKEFLQKIEDNIKNISIFSHTEEFFKPVTFIINFK